MKKIFMVLILILFIFQNLFAQEASQADIINAAVARGDLETLYNFIQEPQGEPRLITLATQTIRRYTAAEAATATYRSNKMDSRVRSVPAELTENVFEDPKTHLPALVTRLTGSQSNQFMKVKIIHDWICDNIAYDVDHYFGRKRSSQDYISVIKNKKAVCSGYASLFNEMCRLASVESITISGYSKGAGYSGYIDYPDHDWNAVKIGTKWYLVDVTWDAGILEYREFIKRYSTDYLFLDSRAFLYTHLPSENKYQFYAPLVTKEQFVKEPRIQGIFFRFNLEIKNMPDYNNQIDGPFTVELIIKNQSVGLSSALRTASHSDIEGADWIERAGNTISFIYDVPDTGNYAGHIFAGIKNERRIMRRIHIYQYENRIVPALDPLVESKKITEKEKELFLNSYYKVEYNGYYYFAEDQFDTARNNAVLKIHPLVNLSLGMMEPVLSFNLKAQAPYAGYQNEHEIRYPQLYTSLIDSTSTKLISPVTGLLKSGDTHKIIISSREYSGFYANAGQKRFNFTRNSEGFFELEAEIPENIETFVIYGIKGNSWSGLFWYIVR